MFHIEDEAQCFILKNNVSIVAKRITSIYRVIFDATVGDGLLCLNAVSGRDVLLYQPNHLSTT